MMTKIEMQAMDAVIGIHREMKKANEVDWEQRRYEIAKEIYIDIIKKRGFCIYGSGGENILRNCAVEAELAANVLIKVLKQ